MQYGRKDKCMNVRWDQTGTKILVLRRKEMPVLYDFNHSKRIAQFFHNNYYNSCTMKSCCFAGLKDEYVLSGSDDFNLYMWKISDAMNSCEYFLFYISFREVLQLTTTLLVYHIYCEYIDIY